MRHGPAEGLGAGDGSDAARHLTPQGRAQTAQACVALSRVVSSPPERIYTSPYTRALETAELLAAEFGTPHPQATPLLAPGFEPQRIAQMLAENGGDFLAIVAHEPDLSGFIAWLSGGQVEMGKGTVCLTELAAPGSARLFALYPLTALDAFGSD